MKKHLRSRIFFLLFSSSLLHVLTCFGVEKPAFVATTAELLEFEVNPCGQNVCITWTTSAENDNYYFTIERSQDGQSYAGIGVVNGSGSNTSLLNYAFTEIGRAHV